MPEKITFSIPGEPQGKDRPRASARIVWQAGVPRAIVSMNTSKETAAAERVILGIFRRRFPHHKPWTGAVLIRFTAIFETPKSFDRAQTAAAKAGKLYCIKKADKDNIEKLIRAIRRSPRVKSGPRQ
jgi:hypothetical protein